MSKREKTLLAAVGVVVGLFIARWGYRSYTGMLASRETEIDNLTIQLSKAQLERANADLARRDWLKFGAQTLSMDPNESQRWFREELSDLAATTGLEESVITMGQVTGSGTKNSLLKFLIANVTAQGDLNRMVDFLFRLYQQPYAVRVRTLTLTQVGGKAPKGMLKLTAKLETPILPPLQKVPTIVPAERAKGRRREVKDRTRLANLADYKSIAQKKIFEPYVPPIPAPVKVASPNPANNSNAPPTQMLSWAPAAHAKEYQVYFGTAEPGQPQPWQPSPGFRPPSPLTPNTVYFWRIDARNESGTTTGDVWRFTVVPQAPPATQPIVQQPVVKPPPADANMVLSRVLSSPRGQQAVLTNPAQQNNPLAPETRVEVGEQMFGGTLIFIHPKGAVTESDGVRRFHPIGAALSANQPLSELDHPEVFQDMVKLEARLKGISQVPG